MKKELNMFNKYWWFWAVIASLLVTVGILITDDQKILVGISLIALGVIIVTKVINEIAES